MTERLLAVAVGGRGLVDPDGPVFAADDEALLRGAAAFETLRVYDRRPFLLDRHLARLERSTTALGLPPADGVDELVSLVAGAAPADHVLRLYRTSRAVVVTGAALPDGLEALRARGIRLRTIDAGRPATLLLGAKATSYAAAMAARRAAEDAGADDALLVSGGSVLDSTTANVWWRSGGTLYTPAVGPGVLPGVTRSLVLELTDVREGRFAPAAVLGADEAFVTSSIREVMPVVAVDGRSIGDGRPGPTAAQLQASLRLRSRS